MKEQGSNPSLSGPRALLSAIIFAAMPNECILKRKRPYVSFELVLVTSISGPLSSPAPWSEMMFCAHSRHGDDLLVCESLCQSGTKEKSWAEKNLRGESEVYVVKKRNVNPVCLKSHLVLPRAHVNHPVLMAFLEVCHTLAWACLYSLFPSRGPPFLSLLMFFVILKTVLRTRNFRHINAVFFMPWGMKSGFSKVFFLTSGFQILVPFDYSKINTWRSWKEPQG